MRLLRSIFHFSDIHFTSAPTLALEEFWGKRLIGRISLDLLGRRKQFSARSQNRVVDRLKIELEKQPSSILIFTGDATSMSLEREFIAARKGLSSLLDGVKWPVFMVPGNHDVYTQESLLNMDFERYFGPWMYLSKNFEGLGICKVDNFLLIGLNPCRPNGFKSSGRVPLNQLIQLRKILNGESEFVKTQGSLDHVILCLHYPIMSSVDESNYSLKHPFHGLENDVELCDLIDNCPIKPLMILHGHVHKRFHSKLGMVPIFNPGCAGYIHDPENDRIPGFNRYDLFFNLEQKKFHLKAYSFLDTDKSCQVTDSPIFEIKELLLKH